MRYSRFHWLHFLFFFNVGFPVLSVSASTEDGFKLDSVASLFPSRGFERQIEFWRHILTKVDSREVLFHDSEDLRLIYHREVFERSIHGDPGEARRQRDYLRRRIKEVQQWFEEIARWGADSERLQPHHREIIRTLTQYGYSVTPEVLRERAAAVRLQRGVRDRFRESLIRSGLFRPFVEETLERFGVPKELSALPHIESSYDYNAYSRAGAAGIWQFTAGTARSYLHVGQVVDERLDPVRATEAAARLLRENYDILGNWPLAITAYNYGRNGMLRAVRSLGPDLLTIIRRHDGQAFGFAGKNFYAEFLAALEASRNYQKYFGDLPIAAPLAFDSVVLDRACRTDRLVSALNLDRDAIARMNPHLRKALRSSQALVPAGVTIHVPEGRGSTVVAALQKLPEAKREPFRTPDGRLLYRVQPGDTLSAIAADMGLSVKDLQSSNRLRSPDQIYVGQELVLPPGTSTAATFAGPPEPAGENCVHIVRPGESLTAIARRYGTTPHTLARLNNLENPDHLAVGARIQLPGGVSAGSECRPASHYRVRPGDTLLDIARRFGCNLADLMNANGIPDPDQLPIGLELLIP
ncbi:MAG TPA: LysM peptidoglycan-binding domain-containing protein [Acidobacteriota bacterium]|nr:LysM peptidoglycan-binding domain-containing protein [Acidobacteriota bacterium]HRR56376.1 LysM peptidoglycan-binding domain-containing protein [Acidobacteriota bacterium]HRV07430.1 LysM peptidoglycan-binding domain-containing protein [Acidobacteriota bacterium]